jgi:hypothetical protein
MFPCHSNFTGWRASEVIRPLLLMVRYSIYFKFWSHPLIIVGGQDEKKTSWAFCGALHRRACFLTDASRASDINNERYMQCSAKFPHVRRNKTIFLASIPFISVIASCYAVRQSQWTQALGRYCNNTDANQHSSNITSTKEKKSLD